MTRRANIAIPDVINLVLTVPTEHHRDADAPVLHAAVLGWYEGHIEGEDSSGHAPQMPTTFPSNEMPSPPFPGPGPDSPVRKVAAEVNDRCDPADLNGRVALAAALGWIGGWADGRSCPGCTPRGRENLEGAASLRAVRIRISGPSSPVTAAPANGASPQALLHDRRLGGADEALAAHKRVVACARSAVTTALAGEPILLRPLASCHT